MPSARATARQHDPRPAAIDQTSDAKREERTDQRRDEVDLRVGDATDTKIADQRLGDEPQALRTAGQRAHHRQGGDAQHDPSVIEPSGRYVRRDLLLEELR